MSRIQGLVRKFDKPVLIVLSATALTSILLHLEFNFLEARLYDLRMVHGSHAAPDPGIVLVSLDDASTNELNDFAPLPLDAHTLIMEQIEKLNPRAVGYLVNMNFVNQVNPELFDSPWSQRFVEAVHRLETRGVPVILGTPFDVNGEVVPPYPLSSLSHAIAVIHKDGNVFSEDKITRRAMTYLYGKPTFHLMLARDAGLVGPAYTPRGSFHVPEADGQYFFFRYHGDLSDRPAANPETAAHDVVAPRFAPTYETHSFVSVLRGQIPEGALDGKIVLVGTATKENPADFALTPYSSAPFTNPKLGVHANILDSIIHDDGLVLAPEWLNWINTFLVTVFVLWCVLTFTPLYGLFATATLAVVFHAVGQLLFSGLGAIAGIWIHESQPLVGIFFAYYLAVPYRLIREYKKRWDYQRRNELLTQVEELKTNFLSLVTHDLKTPVARIQGLAEMVLSKSAEASRENLRHIIQSTEELNRFISSILELSKVQSKGLELKFESKDINQLIERSIEGFATHARAKEIEIEASLEPLFPVRIDPSLMLKVINNLIDNAIKYSPQGSRVTVRSRESGELIEVSVSDQGIGLAPDELSNIFSRFYRAKNETTATVAGTGLGLYLTRYFVEAHLGRVEVESQEGRGSTFKIILPLRAGSAQSPASREGGFLPGLTTRWARRASQWKSAPKDSR